MIGTHLTPLLQKKGYRVIHLSRSIPKNRVIETFLWDVKKQIIDERAVQQADCIIHLAGAGIADKKWTTDRKKEIIDSRVDSIHLLFKTIQKTNATINCFVSASAVGIYGAVTSETIFSENDLPATDFLGITCKLWEGAAETIAKLGIRTVKLRTGVVLSEKEGALKKMAKPIKLFVGSALGSGKQYIPWIHLDDICNIYLKAIEDTTMQGAYNAAAPEHMTNACFTKVLAKILHRPLVMPAVPSFVLKFMFGEMSDVILKGSRVSSEKLMAEGFTFKYTKLSAALKDIFSQQTTL